MKLVCDNCGRTFGDEQELRYVLPDIPGLIDRLDAGGTVPNGECPDCGSLVYMERDRGDASKEADESPKEFLVEWSINVCADTFRQAAEEALRIQRDTESIATVFDVSCPATRIRHTVDLGDDTSHPATFRCRVCGDRVAAADMRSHLCGHNPNADGMEWESVRDEFDQHDADMAAEEGQVGRVVIVVHGGVAEVMACPEGVVVELRDYDTEGSDPDVLATDGAAVSEVEGPFDDRVEGWPVDAPNDLEASGFGRTGRSWQAM